MTAQERDHFCFPRRLDTTSERNTRRNWYGRKKISYLDKTRKQTACIVKSVFHTEYGLNKISSSFAGSDENEPSDLVSTTESVFPADFGYRSVPPT